MDTIIAIDAASCADADVAALHRIALSVARETGAADPVDSAEQMAAAVRESGGQRTARHWLARSAYGAPVGAASLWCRNGEANRHLAGFGLDVLPAARRHGLGTRLLGAVAEAAGAEGRRLLQTWTLEGGVGELFLQAVGGERRSLVRTTALDVRRVDRRLLRRWVAQASERASAYSLVSWRGACPAPRREQVVRVMGAMSTAPRDDLDVEDDVLTVDALVEDERRSAAAGYETWWVCARRDVDDSLVGSTAVTFSALEPPEAHQGDTVVEPGHRNLGLGRWMKAEMLLRILEDRPEVRTIVTDNAVSNAAMRSINDELGFRVVRSNGIWQIPVDAARAACEARLATGRT